MHSHHTGHLNPPWVYDRVRPYARLMWLVVSVCEPLAHTTTLLTLYPMSALCLGQPPRWSLDAMWTLKAGASSTLIPHSNTTRGAIFSVIIG